MYGQSLSDGDGDREVASAADEDSVAALLVDDDPSGRRAVQARVVREMRSSARQICAGCSRPMMIGASVSSAVSVWSAVWMTSAVPGCSAPPQLAVPRCLWSASVHRSPTVVVTTASGNGSTARPVVGALDAACGPCVCTDLPCAKAPGHRPFPEIGPWRQGRVKPTSRTISRLTSVMSVGCALPKARRGRRMRPAGQGVDRWDPASAC